MWIDRNGFGRSLFGATLMLAACGSAPSATGSANRFPPPDRPVASIVSSAFSNEDARDALGEAETVMRLARGVAPGGTLFLVGHLPVDPATGEPSPAAGQVQVTVEDVVAALDAREWNIVLAEERTRPGGTGADAVVRALRVV